MFDAFLNKLVLLVIDQRFFLLPRDHIIVIPWSRLSEKKRELSLERRFIQESRVSYMYCHFIRLNGGFLETLVTWP